MTILASIRRRYITQQITTTPDPSKPKQKKSVHLVMFAEGTGDFYLLDTVPPELQEAGKRKAYFRKHKIEPAAKLVVIDGFLEAVNNTADPAVLDQATSFLEDANNGLGIPYLLAHKFVTTDHMIGMTACAVAVKDLCDDETAIKAAPAVWGGLVEEHKRNATRQLGLTQVTPKYLSSTFGSNEPTKSASPDGEEVADQEMDSEMTEAVKKAQLVYDAQILGIRATKMWTVEQLEAAIAEKIASAASQTVDVPSPDEQF